VNRLMRLSLSELFGILLSALFGIPSQAGRCEGKMAGRGHCVNLLPCPSVTQYSFATLKSQQNRAAAVSLQNRTFEQCTQPGAETE